MEPIAINQRKNEKWQSIEVAKEYYNSLKLVKLYKTAFLAADAVFAFIIGYKLIAGKTTILRFLSPFRRLPAVFGLDFCKTHNRRQPDVP